MAQRTVIQDAALTARTAHMGQVRKYTGEPYIVHPANVATIVASVWPHNEDAIAAAWLHDVIEDTHHTYDSILQRFGIHIASVVDGLTEKATKDMGNRALRKAFERGRLSVMGRVVQTIKVADLMDNTRSIVEHDPGFARVYLDEKKQLLDVMTWADAGLVRRARVQLDQAWRKLDV